MAETSKVKEYVCLANISPKGHSGIKYFKDQFYTKEEVRLAPANMKHKFALIESIRPEAIDGSEGELKGLIQRQQIKINTLEAALAEYEGQKPEKKGKTITTETGGQKGTEKL